MQVPTIPDLPRWKGQWTGSGCELVIALASTPSPSCVPLALCADPATGIPDCGCRRGPGGPLPPAANGPNPHPPTNCYGHRGHCAPELLHCHLPPGARPSRTPDPPSPCYTRSVTSNISHDCAYTCHTSTQSPCIWYLSLLKFLHVCIHPIPLPLLPLCSGREHPSPQEKGQEGLDNPSASSEWSFSQFSV